MLSRPAGALALLLFFDERPESQPLRRRGVQACVFDTAAATLRVPAAFFLEPPADLDSVPGARAQALAYIESLRPHFESPSKLTTEHQPVVTVDQLGIALDSIRFLLGGPLLIPLRADGKLGKGTPIAGTAVPALNEALVAAIKRRDEAKGVSLDQWATSDRHGPVQLTIAVAAQAPPGVLPFMLARIPVYMADRVPEVEDIPRPEYPAAAREVRASAQVDLRYVVTEQGKVDRSTIELLSVQIEALKDLETLAAAFVRSAITALTEAQFKPAVVRGCPVRAVTDHRVSFRIV